MENQTELEALFLDASKFYKQIHDLVLSDDITYVSATLVVCDRLDIEVDDLEKLCLISPLLKTKLQADGIESGVLIKNKFNETF